MSDFPAGTVAVATVSGVESVRVMRNDAARHRATLALLPYTALATLCNVLDPVLLRAHRTLLDVFHR